MGLHLGKGASVGVMTDTRNTPLHLAAQGLHIDILVLLTRKVTVHDNHA